LPTQGMDPALLAVRGDAYRDELGHLSAEVWALTVKDAIVSEEWFPTVRRLLEIAEPHRVAEEKAEHEAAIVAERERIRGHTRRRLTAQPIEPTEAKPITQEQAASLLHGTSLGGK
jgi:hypothetical protein